MFDSVPEVSLK